ncbi:uncharacterized protein [Montipora capricornis]|uniref:uncharacterized protein n=1 Tax=Montipora capricornis TaxID=246305 RepID=UPI0035F16E09
MRSSRRHGSGLLLLTLLLTYQGYSVLRRDCQSDHHGGICLYVKDASYQGCELSCCSEHEILWVQLRPRRLPRGFSSLIVAVVYHPHWTTAENNTMREHLFQSLLLAESRYPNCVLILAGDFNRLDVKSIQRHFRLKQMAKKPTRKVAILDLVLTNLHDFYEEPQHFSPFGLSDHQTVTVESLVIENCGQPCKFVLKRDKRESRKAELGRYLSVIDWSVLFSSSSDCQEMLNIFNKVIHIGLDIIPIKRVRVNTRDAPWMTDNGGESPQYKFYRNTVNRERKSVKASFYQLKVEHMKEENPKCGGAKPSADNVTSHIHIEGIEDMSYEELANVINQAFLEPLEEYRLTQWLTKHPVDEDSPELLEVSELRVMKLLASLNPSKACGPDDIPNWLPKEYTELLAFPVSKIINASFEEQSLPRIWKFALYPRRNQLKFSRSSLDLSLLHHACRKLLKTASLWIMSSLRCFKSWTQTSMVQFQNHLPPKHLFTWFIIGPRKQMEMAQTVRVTLFDYKKAFDLIDHKILVNK